MALGIMVRCGGNVESHCAVSATDLVSQDGGLTPPSQSQRHLRPFTPVSDLGYD